MANHKIKFVYFSTFFSQDHVNTFQTTRNARMANAAKAKKAEAAKKAKAAKEGDQRDRNADVDAKANIVEDREAMEVAEDADAIHAHAYTQLHQVHNTFISK